MISKLLLAYCRSCVISIHIYLSKTPECTGNDNLSCGAIGNDSLTPDRSRAPENAIIPEYISYPSRRGNLPERNPLPLLNHSGSTSHEGTPSSRVRWNGLGRIMPSTGRLLFDFFNSSIRSVISQCYSYFTFGIH